MSTCLIVVIFLNFSPVTCYLKSDSDDSAEEAQETDLAWMAKNNELIAAAKSAISDVLNIEQIVLILIARSKDYRTDHNYLASRSLQSNPLSYLSQQNDQCNGCLQWFKGSDSWLRHIRNCTDINTHRRNNRWR